MNVSEYIFDFLQKKGCETVFMVSGSSAMFLTDALKRNEKLKVICNHHEQAAAMSADMCGRLGQVPGVCLVTIGPGATNAITGVAQAYLDSSPIFILSGQASSKLLQYEIDTGIRQHGTQSLNLEPIVSPITKYFAVVMNEADIVEHMERAYELATSGRKGPVWLDIPVDIQNRQVPESAFEKASSKKYETSHCSDILEEQIQTVVQMISSAKKPLILAGYGVRSANAVEALEELSKTLQIPVVTSRGGIDAINSDNPYFMGRPGAYGTRASHFIIQQCDLLIILGSRLSVSTIGYYPKNFGGNAKKVMVDIDNLELAKSDVPVDVKINGDIRDFIEAVLSSCKEFHQNTEWLSQCKELVDKYPVVLESYRKEKPLNPYYFVEQLSEHLYDDSVILTDTGSVCNIVSQAIKLKGTQRYLISGGFSSMGFWAGAIGAATTNKHTVVLTGDGSAQMNIQELATIKYNKLPIKMFIFKNNGYVLIRHNQHNYMNNRFLGVGPDSGLCMPDFCSVAEAYGLESARINEGDDIEAVLREIMRKDTTVICEVVLSEFYDIAPRIASRVMPDGSLKAAEFDDMYPFLEK